MTKPDPNIPDPETPEPGTPGPDPADAARSPDGDASGAQPSGGTPPPRESPGSPAGDAQSADDDAVWLDLVARLEGVGAGNDDGPDYDGANDDGTGASTGDSNTGASTGDSRPASGGTARPGAPTARAFRDFDPLGLSGAAPIELSAEERLAPAPAKPAAAGGDDEPDTGAGPRDYESDDDDGAFVPEDPPSLAGADPLTVLAWIGAVGGPIALVLSAMFWRSAPMLAILGMVVAFAASLVFLIMKLPGEKDEHDDGARV